jgi:hypothetical protein
MLRHPVIISQGERRCRIEQVEASEHVRVARKSFATRFQLSGFSDK